MTGYGEVQDSLKVPANSPPLGIVIKSMSVSPVLNTKNGREEESSF